MHVHEKLVWAAQYTSFGFFLHEKLVTSENIHGHNMANCNAVEWHGTWVAGMILVAFGSFFVTAWDANGCWHDDKADQWLLEVVMALTNTSNHYYRIGHNFAGGHDLRQLVLYMHAMMMQRLAFMQQLLK